MTTQATGQFRPITPQSNQLDLFFSNSRRVMRSRTHAKQITQNRLNLERAARIKHNPQFDRRSLITDLALLLLVGVK